MVAPIQSRDDEPKPRLRGADAGELLILPHLPACRDASGELVLSRRFLEGAAQYARYWPGPVVAAVNVLNEKDSSLDHEPVGNHRPFTVIERPDAAALQRRIADAALVLPTTAADAYLTREAGVPYVPITIYSLRTRCDILKWELANPLRRAKRTAKEWWEEWQTRQVVAKAAGVQCNGFPTYDAYRRLNDRTMLFFDNRVTSEEVIAEPLLDQRLADCEFGRPLRLVFSGRLIRMKGVDHLPPLADALRRRRVRFEMHICGGGALEQQLAREIQRHNLRDAVHLHGVLHFHRELVPLVQQQADLFVCPHVQGDPSHTYIDMLACGVPVAGYANEALEPLAIMTRAGWSVPMQNLTALADQIAELDGDRRRIVNASRAARAFALRHTFERTFERRVTHFRECAQAPAAR